MIKDITLESDRLILRKFNENDSEKCLWHNENT